VKVDSSFSRLFRQSRYARDTEAEQGQPRQNRRELFAVAAVSFVMKHDTKFASQFLSRVASVPVKDLHHEFQITPQAAACADLVIRDNTNNKHYIVEFKVHSPTEEKQSPATRVFTSARGYCAQMKKRFANLNGRGLTYTVLSKQTEFDDSIVSGVRCRARTWKELIPQNQKESGLVPDLLDSLGNFGIPALRLRNIRYMKNSNDAQGAVEIYELLQSILTEFRPSRMEFGSDETYRWCGMPLEPRKNQYRNLRKWLGHQWNQIGWIGYEVSKGTKKPYLSIWLYFEPEHVRNCDQSIQILKKKLPRKDLERSDVDCDLIVSEPAQRVANDKEWFTHTLHAVLETSVPPSLRSTTR
jgi:hypothetical protein